MPNDQVLKARDAIDEATDPPRAATARWRSLRVSIGAAFAAASIKDKLRIACLGASGLGFAVAAALLAGYFCVAARDETLVEAKLLADLIARHGAPAMVRDDARGAGELLQSLEVTPSVVGARLLRDGGGELAVYRRPGAAEAWLPSPTASVSHRFSWGVLDLTVPVRHEGRVAGVLQLRVSLAALHRQLAGIAIAMTLAVVLALGATWVLLGRWVQAISGRVASLAALASAATRQRDYSLRSSDSSADELGNLARDVNVLLDTIQQTDAVLAARGTTPGRPNDQRARHLQEAQDAPTAAGAGDRVLPVSTHVRWANETPPKAERRAFVGRVLVVEDHPLNQENAMAALATLGVDPALAQNGRRALELLSEKSFDLVLMDCQMPEMDGFEATAAIRTAEHGASASRRLPVIALTGGAEEGDRERWLAAGMDDQLAKPFTPAELDAVLARWLPRMQRTEPVTGLVTRTTTVVRTPGTLAIDARALTMIRAIDPDGKQGLLRNAVQAYITSTAERLGELTAALANRDSDAVEAIAHALRSASDGIGADRFASVLHEVEEHAPRGDIVIVCAIVERAVAEFARVATELRRLVDGRGDR